MFLSKILKLAEEFQAKQTKLERAPRTEIDNLTIVPQEDRDGFFAHNTTDFGEELDPETIDLYNTVQFERGMLHKKHKENLKKLHQLANKFKEKL